MMHLLFYLILILLNLKLTYEPWTITYKDNRLSSGDLLSNNRRLASWSYTPPPPPQLVVIYPPPPVSGHITYSLPPHHGDYTIMGGGL